MRTSLRLVLLAAIASLVWPFLSFAGPQLYTVSVQIDPADGWHGHARSRQERLCEEQYRHGIGHARGGYGVYRLGRRSQRLAEPGHAARQRQSHGDRTLSRQTPGVVAVARNGPSSALRRTAHERNGGRVLRAMDDLQARLPAEHVASSGAAQQMNVMNYAFAAPDANLKCASLDTFADYGKRYDASESVDGVADTVSQPLKGNFNQILKLKKLNPALRVLISLGGWTESYRFSDVALPANREAFVTSCIDMFIKGNVATGISAAGVFDGIDVDWEYPGSCGATCAFRPEDKQNFVALLAEFRRHSTCSGRRMAGSTCSPSLRRPARSSIRRWIFPVSRRASTGSTS